MSTWIKKMVGIISVSLSAAIILTACGSSVATSIASASGGNTKTDSTSAAKPLGVVLIVNGTIGDKSFNDLANAGLKKAASELNVKTKLVENNYDTTKYESVLTEFSESPDWDVMILNSYDMKEIVEKIAPKYPDKKYILYDADIDFTTQKHPNVYSTTYKQNEASFLAGALASKLTSSGIDRTNKDKLIGFVAGGENTVINDFLMGYIEGSKYGDPAVKMFISYIGDFKNTAKGKEMAMAQYLQNADISFQVAAGAGIGVIDAAREKNRFAIGVDSDQYELLKDSNPDQAKAIVTSVVKKVDSTIFNCIKRAADNTLPWGTNEVQGLKEGAVGIVKNEYYKSIVPADIQTFVDETEKKIVSGEIKVDTTIGMPTDAINEVRNSIKP